MHCLIRRGKTDKVQPVLYVAKGSHAIYPKEGAIDHTFPNANSEIPFLLVDYCNKGPRYDPLHSSYMYMYSPPESPSPKTVQGAEVPGSLQPWRPRRCPQAGCTLRAIGAIKRIRTTIRGRRTRTFLGSADMAMDRQDQRSRAWRGRRCGRRTRMLRDRGSSRAWTGVRGGRIGGHDAKRRASVRQG